jgi:long-chain fatty acid transport protein
MKRRWIDWSVAAVLGASAPTAQGGAFGIATQTGAGTGNAFAGGAAVAEDASVAWSNPAAMPLLGTGKHLHAAGHIIRTSFEFRDEGSTIPPALGSGSGDDGGGWAFVPNGAFVMGLTNDVSFGITVNAPFGLKTEYPQGWIGQRIALTSEILSVNVNPSIAYRISPSVSIGAGISVQYLEAKLTNASVLGTSKLEADDIGYGFNIGAIVQATPATRFGLHYRSSIEYDLEGDVTFTGVPAANAAIRADLRVPESASLSLFSALSPQWEVMADLTWTRWSRIKSIVPTCESASFAVCTGSRSPVLGATLATNWKDTWRIGVGANYRHSPTWKFRFGLAYDPTPTNDTDRTARLPDEDRFWVTVGAQYTLSRNARIEVGYAHEFLRKAQVNTQVTGTAFRQIGHFEDSADILTVAYSHRF